MDEVDDIVRLAGLLKQDQRPGRRAACAGKKLFPPWHYECLNSALLFPAHDEEKLVFADQFKALLHGRGKLSWWTVPVMHASKSCAISGAFR